jgi:GTPase
MKHNTYRSGFVGLIGQPNAGKSSLLNFLVAEKVSIVTSKPQTTRRRVLGLTSMEQGQIVFVDAPGLVKSTSGLNPYLQREAEDVIKNSDAVVAVLSIDESDVARNEEILQLVAASGKPWMAAITKTDLREKAHRVIILRDLVSRHGGTCFEVSTTNDKRIERDDIVQRLLALLPETGAPLFDPDLFTTESQRSMAEEIVREKCFETLEHEIPYFLAVATRQFDEESQPCPKIHMDLIVSKISHKPIVIGRGGEQIKRIGELARTEIQKMMGVNKVFLDLKVVVKENWFEQKNILKDLRYVVPNE